MWRLKNMKNRKQMLLLFLGIILINNCLITILKANSNFTNGLELGTQIYEVKHFDEITWKNTVNFTKNPNHWFGGEANIVGAKSKLTIEGWYYTNFMTSVFFATFFYSNKTLSLFPIVKSYGYGETYINEYYSHYYTVCSYDYHYWPFTTGEFDIHPSYDMEHSMFMQNPQEFQPIFENYNEFAGIITNDTTLQSLNISFPFLTGDDFMWQFVMNRFVVGTPINDYLTTMLNVLESKNVTIQDNTLIFQRLGEQNYTVEVTYNKQGIMETFNVKNSEGYTIYKITSSYPKTVFFIIVGIIASSVLGIVILFVIKKNYVKDTTSNRKTKN